MMELRWLKRKYLNDEHLFERVLQFRMWVWKGNEITGSWSDWQDVPVVEEK